MAGNGVAVWEWRTAFLQRGPDDPYVRLVGLAGAHYANVTDGTAVRPGMRLLVESCQLDKRTIRDRLAVLERDGWYLRTDDGGSPTGGKRRAREWRLIIPALGTPDVPGTRDAPGTPGVRDQVHPMRGPGTPDVPPPLHTPAAPLAPECPNCDDTGWSATPAGEVPCGCHRLRKPA